MTTQVFVGNLNYGVSEADIRVIFANYGSVSSVSVVTDRDTGRPRGIVEMGTMAEAQRAVQALHQKEMDGRVIDVYLPADR